MPIELDFNQRQSEKVADLCFDLTKGLLLGGFGLVITGQLNLAIIGTIMLTIVSVLLVKFGLFLLR